MGSLGMFLDCVSCGASLPLRRAAAHEQAVDWVCKLCEAVYHAVLIEECPPAMRAKVQLTAFRFNEREIALPPRSLIKAVRDLANKTDPSDKRGQVRRVMNVPILTMPLSENLQPIGEPFATISRNISAGGICLMSDRKVAARFVAVQLPRVEGKTIQVAMEIVRSRHLEGFVELAGKFVSRMYT